MLSPKRRTSWTLLQWEKNPVFLHGYWHLRRRAPYPSVSSVVVEAIISLRWRESPHGISRWIVLSILGSLHSTRNFFGFVTNGIYWSRWIRNKSDFSFAGNSGADRLQCEDPESEPALSSECSSSWTSVFSLHTFTGTKFFIILRFSEQIYSMSALPHFINFIGHRACLEKYHWLY